MTFSPALPFLDWSDWGTSFHLDIWTLIHFPMASGFLKSGGSAQVKYSEIQFATCCYIYVYYCLFMVYIVLNHVFILIKSWKPEATCAGWLRDRLFDCFVPELHLGRYFECNEGRKAAKYRELWTSPVLQNSHSATWCHNRCGFFCQSSLGVLISHLVAKTC